MLCVMGVMGVMCVGDCVMMCLSVMCGLGDDYDFDVGIVGVMLGDGWMLMLYDGRGSTGDVY